MSHNVPFIFGLSPDDPPLTEQSDLWSAPLPMRRQAFHDLPDTTADDAAVTYGDYFTAARDYLCQDNYTSLIRAAGLMTGRTVAADNIRQVAVYLLKHGAFYHPACVKLDLGHRELTLVLNVAVSQQGRKALTREFDSLTRLNTTFDAPDWPAVYGQGSGRTHGGQDLPMFIGQWFSGWYEFHLTRETGAGPLAVAVWDTRSGRRTLEQAQVPDLMRRAAAILTCAYNPLTFEAIVDWHHAAGDFVVRTSPSGLDVRLITVRNYAPFLRHPAPDIEAVLEGLVLYLVNLSLRLRLDRLDGVGEPAAYPDVVVPAICKGFWQGLARSAEVHRLPQELLSAAAEYAQMHGPQQLAPLADAVCAGSAPASADGRLLGELMQDHLHLLARSLAPSAAA